MAYINGTANSWEDLQAALISACTANGWTLSGSDIVYKGNCFAQLFIDGDLDVLGVTGIGGSVSGVMQPNSIYIGFNAYITFPVSYDIHILTDPDEVYLIVNYNGDMYRFLSFGSCDVAGVDGMWVTGSTLSYESDPEYEIDGVVIEVRPYQIYFLTDYYSNCSCAPFGGGNRGDYDYNATFVYTNVTGSYEWSGIGWYNSDNTVGGVGLVAGLLNSLPNGMNGTTVLLPIKAMKDMGDHGQATTAELRHARYCRIDYLDVGDVVEYGGDKWIVYPWLRKDATDRNAERSDTLTLHSGTFGWAIRYTGA